MHEPLTSALRFATALYVELLVQLLREALVIVNAELFLLPLRLLASLRWYLRKVVQAVPRVSVGVRLTYGCLVV